MLLPRSDSAYPESLPNEPYCLRFNNKIYMSIFLSILFSGMMVYKHSKNLMHISFIVNCLQFHNALYGDAKGWARIFFSFLRLYIPGVMNPHAKVVQQWNKFFIISCLVAIFVDPLFFFLLSVQKVLFVSALSFHEF